MPQSRKIYKYEPPPIFKDLMKTLLEMNSRMDTIQTDLKLLQKIVAYEKEYEIILMIMIRWNWIWISL